MKIHGYRHPSWLTNCYLLVDDDAKGALLVDAGAPPDYYAEQLKEIPLLAILLTHDHEDHTENLGQWRTKYHCPLVAFPQAGKQHWGSFTVEAIKTPGHCADHLVFIVNSSSIFTGDLLFKGSIGGTAHGNFNDLKNSLLYLLNIPDDVVVYPGHAAPTSIGDERQHNPFLRFLSGELSPLGRAATFRGRTAEVLVEGRDYDGDMKQLLQLSEGGERHVTCL